MAVASHTKALAAQSQGKFDAETVPVETRVVGGDGAEHTLVVSHDEGPRVGTSLEKLAKLKTVFKPNGSVTAGTSSQVSDGAAAVLLMSRAKARQLGLRPLGVLRSYRVVGCKPRSLSQPVSALQPGLSSDTTPWLHPVAPPRGSTRGSAPAAPPHPRRRPRDPRLGPRPKPRPLPHTPASASAPRPREPESRHHTMGDCGSSARAAAYMLLLSVL